MLRLKRGFIKYCLFNSRATYYHSKLKDWPERTDFVCSKSNINNEPLPLQENDILPPLHIKLCLMKFIVQAMDKNGKGLLYLKVFLSN